MPLLNEWFIYDFKLKNGKSPLEDYLERHYSSLSPKEIQLYRKLIESNFYALFEVKEVDMGKGLKLTDLRANKVYDVVEKSGTYTLKPPYAGLVAARSGKVKRSLILPWS